MVKLVEVLKNKNEDLLNKLEDIKNITKPLLGRTIASFSEYTIHCIEHSEKVIEKLDLIIPDSLKEELNEYEIFFLLASAYLHDIGMIRDLRKELSKILEKAESEIKPKNSFDEKDGLLDVFDEEIFERFKRQELAKNPEISDEEIEKRFVREWHHLISEIWIRQFYDELRIKDDHQAYIIGRICRGHRNKEISKKILEELKEKEDVLDTFLFEKKVYLGNEINLRLLASLLRIADELDIEHDRAPKIIYKILDLNLESDKEWRKHFSVSGVTISRDDPLLIIGDAICEDPEIHRMLKKWERKVENELRKLQKYIPYSYKISGKPIPPTRVEMRIDARGYYAPDIRFRLNERAILKLLQGLIYKDKYVAIRELLQNSVDACRRRREILKKKGNEFKPKIVFKLTGDGKLIVEDNGTGMNLFTIRNYLAEIGSCFYTSPEFKAEDLEFNPVSRFGIGILSCFMIADKIEIETKAENDKAWFVEIESLYDYFLVRDGKRESIGTKVILNLKDEIRNKIEKGEFNLSEKVKYWARHLEDIPIEIITPDGEETFVGSLRVGFDWNSFEDCEIELYAEKNGFNYFLKAENARYILEPLKEIWVKPYLLFPYKKDGVTAVVGFLTVPIFRVKQKGYGDIISENIYLSVDGIFVKSKNLRELLSLPPSLPLIVVNADIESYKVELNASRDTILNMGNLISIIYQLICETTEKLIEKARSSEMYILIYDLGNDEFIRTKLSIDTIFSNYLGEVFKYDPIPECLFELLKKWYKFYVYDCNKIKRMGYDEILESEKRSVLLLDSISGVKRGNSTLTIQDDFIEILRNCKLDENELYIIDEWFYRLIGSGFVRIPIKGLIDHYVKIEEPKESIDLSKKFGIPFIRFTNYGSRRLVEAIRHKHYYSNIFINIEHRFIRLILTNFEKLSEIEDTIMLFFQYIKEKKPNHVIKKQKQILQHCIQKGIINEEEAKKYELTKDDFPPSWFKN